MKKNQRKETKSQDGVDFINKQQSSKLKMLPPMNTLTKVCMTQSNQSYQPTLSGKEVPKHQLDHQY